MNGLIDTLLLLAVLAGGVFVFLLLVWVVGCIQQRNEKKRLILNMAMQKLYEAVVNGRTRRATVAYTVDPDTGEKYEHVMLYMATPFGDGDNRVWGQYKPIPKEMWQDAPAVAAEWERLERISDEGIAKSTKL